MRRRNERRGGDDRDGGLSSWQRATALVTCCGGMAVHTGSRAIYAAGHHIGAQYSVQANLMEKPTVWDAMAKAYETAKGDLAERLLWVLPLAGERRAQPFSVIR
ncbi:MAG: DUF1028 domain-containing protein [Candidatus Eisenbacteria bacterium]